MRSEELVLRHSFRPFNRLTSVHTVRGGSVAVPLPLRWHILPEFIFWHYKDDHSLTIEIIFSLHNDLPVSALGDSSVAAQLFPPLSESGPALWRNESPGCLKAQPVSGPEGLAIHSLHIVLQATIGCMGLGPLSSALLWTSAGATKV